MPIGNDKVSLHIDIDINWYWKALMHNDNFWNELVNW